MADQHAFLAKQEADRIAAEEAKKREVKTKTDDKIKKVETALHDKVVKLVADATAKGTTADPDKAVDEALKQVVSSEVAPTNTAPVPGTPLVAAATPA